MSAIIKATPEDAGCWLESSRGHYIGMYAVRIAEAAGMPLSEDDSLILSAYAQDKTVVIEGGELVIHGQQDAGPIINDQGGLCDQATEWLTENVAPDGYEFEWVDGELHMSATAE